MEGREERGGKGGEWREGRRVEEKSGGKGGEGREGEGREKKGRRRKKEGREGERGGVKSIRPRHLVHSATVKLTTM